jgi:hypothetical protein
MSNRKSLRFGELSTEIAYTPPVTPRELGLALSLVDPDNFIYLKLSTILTRVELAIGEKS